MLSTCSLGPRGLFRPDPPARLGLAELGVDREPVPIVVDASVPNLLVLSTPAKAVMTIRFGCSALTGAGCAPILTHIRALPNSEQMRPSTP